MTELYDRLTSGWGISEWTPIIHRVKYYYAGIADRFVLDCHCGWHEILCDYDLTAEETRRKLTEMIEGHESLNLRDR